VKRRKLIQCKGCREGRLQSHSYDANSVILVSSICGLYVDVGYMWVVVCIQAVITETRAVCMDASIAFILAYKVVPYCWETYGE
jgi:hypothetical protein